MSDKKEIMQREIKFRAWLTNDEGKSGMCYDYAANSRQNGEIIKSSFHSKSDFYLVKECVLMQFTGLYDKHNNPIYEGDILKGQFTNPLAVVYENGCFCFYNDLQSGNDRLHQMRVEKLEVIGNVFENPELLG